MKKRKEPYKSTKLYVISDTIEKTLDLFGQRPRRGYQHALEIEEGALERVDALDGFATRTSMSLADARAELHKVRKELENTQTQLGRYYLRFGPLEEDVVAEDTPPEQPDLPLGRCDGED